MKIIMVCMAGITTNVLAGKLQAYGENRGYPDTFTACKIGVCQELLPQADMILVAPQARFRDEELKKEAQKQGIPLFELNEKDFVLANVERIYELVNASRKSDQSHAVLQPLNGRAWLAVIGNALLSCVPLFVLGFFAWALFLITGNDLCYITWQTSGWIIGLYLMFSVGYQYGVQTGTDSYTGGIIALGAPLLMLPTSELDRHWNAFFRVSDGYIPASFFGLRYAVFLVLLSVLAVWILNLLGRFRWKRTGLSRMVNGGMLETAIKSGIVFSIFLGIRIMLEYFYFL